MGRYRTYGRGDETRADAGESRWVGVKMRGEPHLVPEGYAYSAVNMRFNAGVPESRLGFVQVPWLNKITGSAAGPWGTVYGVGSFKDPRSGVEFVLLANADGVFAARPNTAAVSVPLPAGVTLSGPVTFKSGVDVVVLLRGSAGAPLVMTDLTTGFETSTKVDEWDAVADYTTGRMSLQTATGSEGTDGQYPHGFIVGEMVKFSVVSGGEMPAGLTAGKAYYVGSVPTEETFTLEDAAGDPVEFTSNGSGLMVRAEDGTVSMPNSLYGLFSGNRLWLIYGDEVYASDLLDYTRVAVNSALRIQQGQNGNLVALAAFGRELICFKERAVLKLGNLDDPRAAVQGKVTDRYGCIAPRSVADVGTDLLWLSGEGVASLTLTQYGEVQAGQGALSGRPPMFSDDIEPLLKRVNWNFASGAVAAFWDKKYYLAVPLDDAELPGEELAPVLLKNQVMSCAVSVTQGAQYRFTMATGVSLVNGAETLTNSRDFVAAGASVTLTHTQAANPRSWGSLTQVRKGVNNAVLVYDLQNGAWSGHDEGVGLSVRHWFIFPYNNKLRLWFVSEEGWVNLYEEDFEDQRPVPYVDVVITGALNNGGTGFGDVLQVNGGDAIAVASDVFNGDAPGEGGITLGASTYQTGQSNLWCDWDYTRDGYYPQASGLVWSAPNTRAAQLAGGVRFYATNGVLPTVALTYGGALRGWAVTRYGRAPIVTELVTRGLRDPNGQELLGRWVEIDVQTWNPSTSYSLVLDGVSEEVSLASAVTKDRTRYTRPFNAPAFDVSNVNGDFSAPYREDYSVVMGADDTLYEGTGNGAVRGDLLQSSTASYRIGERGQSVQVKVVNGQGRIRVTGVGLELALSPRGRHR